MATPVEAVGRELPRCADDALMRTIGLFAMDSTHPDFVVPAPTGLESPQVAHDRRVVTIAQVLTARGTAFESRPLPFQKHGAQAFGVHFDDDPCGWSFQVHTTLAVGGEVWTGRQNLKVPLQDCIEAARCLRDGGWPHYVDPDVITDAEVWHARLSPGDTVVFHVGNARDKRLPAGSWHDFSVPNSDRRVVVTHFLVNPPSFLL